MKRSKKILVYLALVVFAAAQVFGLFLLVRPMKAQRLSLSETSVVLKTDQGFCITHTVEPDRAAGKLIKYTVTAPDGIVAWVDEQNEMIVALKPGVCRVKGILDGLEAVIDVTVTEDTAIAGEWLSEDGTSLSIENDLSGTINDARVTWTRTVFDGGEIKNAHRYVKLTAERDGARLVLYYDRLLDALRLSIAGETVILHRAS